MYVLGRQGKDSNAAVPGVTLVEEKGHQKDLTCTSFVQLGSVCGPVVGRPSPPPLPT